MHDRIEKAADYAAPIDRLWKAISDPVEFGAWFRVELDGPFVVGQTARGRMLYPGYENLVWEARITAMDAPTLFAFTWHPYALDPEVDYAAETPTLVEFRLEPTPAGTRLTLTESGFDALPAHRRDEAFVRNDRGWSTQIGNIRDHVEP